MKNLNAIFGRTANLLGLAALLGGAAQAAPVTLSVNSSLSTLTLGGWAFAPTIVFTATPGYAGANVDNWGGTINADLTAGVFTFSGGSTITALLNPVSPQPWPALSPAFPTAPYPTISGMDNYGVQGGPTLQPPYGVVTIQGAYRSMTIDLTAGTAQNGLATAATVTWTGGVLDWGATTGVGPFGGTSALATGPQPSAANASLGLVSWDGTTLTLPIQISNSLSSNSHETWTGVIVATLVPEPSTLVVGMMGLGLFAFARARARRS